MLLRNRLANRGNQRCGAPAVLTTNEPAPQVPVAIVDIHSWTGDGFEFTVAYIVHNGLSDPGEALTSHKRTKLAWNRLECGSANGEIERAFWTGRVTVGTITPSTSWRLRNDGKLSRHRGNGR